MGHILITGGAGYIGSHIVWSLHDMGISPIIIDDLSTGSVEFLPESVDVVVGDYADHGLLEGIVSKYGPMETVIHMAGKIEPDTSLQEPLYYYRENTAKAIELLEFCKKQRIKNFIFSSTAAVYAPTDDGYVSEESETAPVTPYGQSKLMTEQIIQDTANICDLNFVILRYFNVAGADPKTRTGQTNQNAKNLFAMMTKAVLGQISSFDIYGDDYDTRDGSCIRDYIHVQDLAEAHIAALDYLNRGGESLIANCGYGRGTSVKEAIDIVKQNIDQHFEVRVMPRRNGDIPFVVSKAAKISQKIGWTPKHDDIAEIIQSSVAWQKFLTEKSGEREDAKCESIR